MQWSLDKVTVADSSNSTHKQREADYRSSVLLNSVNGTRRHVLVECSTNPKISHMRRFFTMILRTPAILLG
uniref:Uncharacterized protein n=1 Tax=Physcomitrium patens TaxID=3218 RepID=A0A7I4A124_PHYPA